MKEKESCSCIFCGGYLDTKIQPKNTLTIHRWCKAPQKEAKREKTWMELPTCATCYSRLFPNLMKNRVISYIPLCLGIIAMSCVLVSFVQRDLFSVYSLLSIVISLLLCVGGAFGFTYFGFFLAFELLNGAFDPSIKVKPYSDLEVVKYIKESGFVDEKDDNYKIINTNDKEYVSFLIFRDTLRNRFGLK